MAFSSIPVNRCSRLKSYSAHAPISFKIEPFADLLTPISKTTKEGLRFSFGMGITKIRKRQIWVASGVSPGFNCCVTYDPIQQKAILVMTDSNSLDDLGFQGLLKKL